MGHYRADAVVLRTRDYGEADKLLTLYTRHLGKVQAIVKGVRKPKSKMRGGVQFLSLSDFLIYQGRTLDVVTQCELCEPFTGIREDLARLAFGAYFAELLDDMVPERETNQEVFLLFLSVLHLLSGGEQEELVARLFEVRLITLLGYRPQTGNCVNCGAPAPEREVSFSVPLGGVLCSSCETRASETIRISRGALAAMGQLQRMDLRLLHRLKLSQALLSQLADLMQKYILYRSERQLKSRDFLLQVQHLDRQ